MIERISKSNSKILHQCGQCDECVEILDHAYLKMHRTFSTKEVTFAKYLKHRMSPERRSV
jgi:polyferredoxin